jgi:hypothetical protein
MDRHLLTLDELDASSWASCGPASLAALLGKPLSELRHAFPNQREGRTWTTWLHMISAIDKLGIRKDATHWHGDDGRAIYDWPRRGLALISFNGSWDALPHNHPAQLQRTHWIAVSPLLNQDGTPASGKPTPMVFDVNLLLEKFEDALVSSGGWTTRGQWEARVAPALAEAHGKRATGKWWVRLGLEVKP